MSIWLITSLALAVAAYLSRHRIAEILHKDCKSSSLLRIKPEMHVHDRHQDITDETVEDMSGETTPKAKPVPSVDAVVPAMVLDATATDDGAISTPVKQSMPPPPPPASRLAAPRQSLAPSRLSPAAQARQSLAPSLTPTSSTMNNARGKVILAPGHSPLDWAALCRSTNLSGVQALQRVTPTMLRAHHGRKGIDAWSSYRGKVYNISPYLPFHPGGEGQLMRAAGKDGTKLFEEAHAWVNWDNMMSSCVVGILVPETEQGLDGLD